MRIDGIELPALKANLHTHSTTSDGYFPLETVAKIYKDAGYDVLGISDHWKSNDVTKVNVPGITMVSGIELHPWMNPDGPRQIMWHILAVGVPSDFPGEYETGQEAVKAAKSVGALVYAAHPRWCGFQCSEVLSLGDIDGLEVFNTGCRLIGREYNMQMWDEMLDMGHKPCRALANDDCHLWTEFGGGWNMICAYDRTQDAIMEALRAGRFYATQGPEFSVIECVDGHFHAEFSEAETAVLISNRNQGYAARVPAWPRPDSTAPAKYMDVDLSMFPKGSYIRCQIKDKYGHYAWSQPYYV